MFGFSSGYLMTISDDERHLLVSRCFGLAQASPPARLSHDAGCIPADFV